MLLEDQASYPFSIREPEHLVKKKKKKQSLVFAILFFWSWSNVCEHRWRSERRSTFKLRASSFGSALSTCFTPDFVPIPLSISHSIFPTVVNKTLRHLKLSTWTWPPPWSRNHSTLFQLKSVTLDLEALILNPSISHTAANCSSENWWLWSDKANMSISSAKRRHSILRPPNWISSTPWLSQKNSVHQSYKQNWGQRATWVESNSYQKWAILTADQALTLAMKGPNSLYQKAWHPILLQYPPQDSQRNTFECLLQIHKHMSTGWANMMLLRM